MARLHGQDGAVNTPIDFGTWKDLGIDFGTWKDLVDFGTWKDLGIDCII